MKKVERLAPEQIAALPEARDMWLKIGLNCDPCDFERAKAGAIEAYKTAGLEPPKLFFVADSPLSCAVMATMLKNKGDQVWDQVGAQVRAQVRAQVFGSHDASWLSFHWFFNHHKICDTSKLNGLWEIAQSCGWWLPMRNAVIFQHRHDQVHLVDGELHNESGPSVHYRDGFSVWSIRGVRVDEQIVMKPETQTIKQINGEENAEIKRIRIERYGWDKYLAQTNAQVLEERKNDIEATVESLMQTGDMRVLVGACPSTGRVYAMEVDPSCNSCDAAKNYLQGGKKLNLIGAS